MERDGSQISQGNEETRTAESSEENVDQRTSSLIYERKEFSMREREFDFNCV